MCGRYALGLRPHEVRNVLQNEGMHVNEGPEDQGYNVPKPNYNLAPGGQGLVYLAHKNARNHEGTLQRSDSVAAQNKLQNCEIQYKLQTMSWGLIPNWTKKKPDYGFLLKTMNCRDDSLSTSKPMWNSIKCTKRCVVIAQGFYEWQKDTERIPHYIHRKDGKLLCLAGLYDCVKLDGIEGYHFTFTIITTNSNEQLGFLHHRMPVILENASDELRTWLDPNRSSWSMDLQNLLKPSNTKLEVYPVSKDVGKLVNNSPKLILPVVSYKNNSKIADFFGKSISENSINQAPSALKINSRNDIVQSPDEINLFNQRETTELEIAFYESTINEDQQATPKEDAEITRKRKLGHIIDDDQKKITPKAIVSSKIFSSTPRLDGKNLKINEIKGAHKPSDKIKSNKKITDFWVM